MEKAYTKEEYRQAAQQANSEGKFLYRVITQVKYTVTVLEWEDEEHTIPKMIKKEVPVYDESGELIRIDIVKVQASHEEDAYKDVEVLDIKPVGYYYLIEDNLTDGSVNANYAKEDFEKNFFETSLGWIRRVITNADGSHANFLYDILPAVTTAVAQGIVYPLIVYSEPDFTEEVIDWTQYQSLKPATSQFIQECLTQIGNDFKPVNEGE